MRSSNTSMKVDLWGLFNRLFVMAAAANFLYNLMPYAMLFLPDGAKNQTGSSPSPFSPVVHEPFSEERRIQMKNEARKMFYWGYDNYMLHAFPYDELNPINCSGRGHDWERPYVGWGVAIMCMRVYTDIRTCVGLRVRLPVNITSTIHTHTHAHTHTHTHTHTHACMHVACRHITH